MVKSELIEKIAAEREGMQRGDVEVVVNLILDSIGNALAAGDHVELRGFGSFTVREHNPHIGRNPKTGEPVEVAAKKVPHFKAGKLLREMVDASRA